MGEFTEAESDEMGKGTEGDVSSPRKWAMPVAGSTEDNGEEGLEAEAFADRLTSDGEGRKRGAGACVERGASAQSHMGDREATDFS